MRRLQAKGNGTVSQTEVLTISHGKDLGEEFDRPSASSNGRIQVDRHVKGNQEWNNEFQTKADELERLFASHKLRVRGDRIVPDHGGKTPDSQFDGAPATPVESVIVHDIHSEMGFHGNCETGFANNQICSYMLNDGGLTENLELRGKFYGRYAQMRDAKLMEEWRLERDTKEAKLKALQDRLDQCWVEMEATKFPGSAKKHDSSVLSFRREEKLRDLLDRDQRSDKQDIVQNYADDCSGEIDQNQNRPVGETSSDNGSSITAMSKRKSSEACNDGSSKGAISKKIVSSSKNIPSLASVKPTAQLVKPSSRPASVAGTRKQQPEQSISSTAIKLPALRKQIAKPLTGIGKEAHRTQPGKYTRNVGSYEDKSQAKEQKPHRSQVKKNSVSPVDCGDSSPRKLANAPTKLSRENPGGSRVQEAIRPKSFLRKGRGKEPSAQNCILEQPASVTPLDTGDGVSKGSMYDVDDSSIIDKEDQQVVILSAEEASRTDSVHSNCVKPDMDEASMSSLRGEAVPISSPVVTEFNIERSISLGSNGVFDTYSCVQDESDIVVSMHPSVDPLQQVHPLNWMSETSSIQSRRWASADEPKYVDNAPRQARKKDVTSGLKWLLRFGRRRKGTESATHSGRGYDTQDPREHMNQLTDDMRKSRIEFAQHHSFHGSTAADEGFDRRGT